MGVSAEVFGGRRWWKRKNRRGFIELWKLWYFLNPVYVFSSIPVSLFYTRTLSSVSIGNENQILSHFPHIIGEYEQNVLKYLSNPGILKFELNVDPIAGYDHILFN